MARRTSRFVAMGDIGLMPTPESSRMRFLSFFSITLFRKSINIFAAGVPDLHSIPA